MALSVATAATLISGGVVAATGGPAAAACDAQSVGKPYHDGSYVRAHASICAATNWTAYAGIQRWRGVYWNTVVQKPIHGGGINKTVQGPVAWKCAGAGTYTYRGRIWSTNEIVSTSYEYSAKTRFKC
jgi:hypothetical protein